jgi:hypothetical protein
VAETLTMWAIYDSPADHPGKFVTRRWDVGAAGPVPGEACAVSTLEEARALVPDGCFNLRRAPGDDPTIVETWL